ncbi:MAG: hypothetical protein AB7J19_15245, partial [Beijerinckiaceae bacterium]
MIHSLALLLSCSGFVELSTIRKSYVSHRFVILDYVQRLLYRLLNEKAEWFATGGTLMDWKNPRKCLNEGLVPAFCAVTLLCGMTGKAFADAASLEAFYKGREVRL